MQNSGLVYNKIVDCLADCRHLIASSSCMNSTDKAICEVDKRMQEPMQLAIVGRISSSKSTLVNAILGKSGIVRTGHEAETFNVSWLKYGDDNAPLVVWFKNGTRQLIERNKWAEWTSHKGENTLKTEVKYIEVTASFNMLRYINIIDTPGLDATSKVDSQNTIDFLRFVNPDAVILLFTKSLAEDSLNLIREFQNSESGMSFSINPMNALGLLSKADCNWNGSNDPMSDSEAAIKRTLSSRTDVNKVLFRILPVSALIALASFEITNEDIRDFEILAKLEDKQLKRLFIGSDFFVREYDFMKISSERRKRMIDKYGLYGVHLCVGELQRNSNITRLELSEVLREKSGFENFKKLLVSHFGDRSQLIKAQRGVISLLKACNKDRLKARSKSEVELVDKVYSRIRSIETDLHELKEWSLLLGIYEGKISVEDEFMKEFLLISGETGHAVTNKLGVDNNTDIIEMERIANARCKYWKTEYNSWYHLSIRKAEPYAVISKSYELLAMRLKEQIIEFEKAQRVIKIFNHYVYGKEIK